MKKFTLRSGFLLFILLIQSHFNYLFAIGQDTLYLIDQTGNYNPIIGNGTSVFLSDDEVSGTLPIGFSFNFFGNTYTDFYISSNGFITFDNIGENGCCSGQLIPNANDPNNLIAFAWVDLSPNYIAGEIEYFTTGSAPNRKLIVNFNNVPHYGGGSELANPNAGGGGNYITTQLQLHEVSNAIEIHTSSMISNGGEHTMGIENEDGAYAYSPLGRNASDWSITDDFVRFYQPNFGFNNAGISSLVEPINFCEGIQDISVVINNYGRNVIDSVVINWEFNDTLQSPVLLITPLDTFGGSGSNNLTVLLGSKNFVFSQTYSIKAWTSNPNGVQDTININDTLNVSNTVGLEGVFTIGGNSPDYQTFSAAIEDLNNYGLCGPVIFNVRNGTYYEQIVLANFNGSSATNTVTFQSELGDSTAVVLTANSTDYYSNYTVLLDGASHIIFKKIHLQSLNEYNGHVVQFINQNDGIQFENCIIEGVSTTSTGTEMAIIYAGPEQGGESFGALQNESSGTIQNEFSGNAQNYSKVFVNNLIQNGSYGFYCSGYNSLQSDSGIVITDNHFMNQNYIGIYLEYPDNVLISNNVINNTSENSYFFGIYAGYLYNGFEISNNKIFCGNGQYGIYLYEGYGSTEVHGKVINNFIQVGGSEPAYGMYFYYSYNTDILFNNVHITSNNTNSYAGYFYYGDNINLLNNNFVNSGDGLTLYLSDTSILLQSDYNNLYAKTNDLGYIEGNLINDLTSWQNNWNIDQNSKSVDPLFVSDTDLHISEIDLNSNGIPINGITSDIDGDTRDLLNPDIGADEFDPPLIDAGVNLIVSPNTPFRAGTGDIIVSLKNFGLNDITSATIEWELNGITQTPFVFSGSLASGDTTHLTIGSNSFADGVNYDFKAWSVVSGDAVAANDTIELLDQHTGLSGIYTIGGLNPDFISFTTAIEAINSRGVVDSVIFNVRNGTYTEQISLIPFLGPNVANTVTFQSETNDSTAVILTFASNSTNNFTVNLQGADGITFRKLTIRATNTTYARVFNIMDGADNIGINNCILQGVTTTSTSDLRAIIYSGTSKDNNNSFTHNRFLNGSQGMYYLGNGTGSSYMENGTVIENNHFFNQYAMGIQIEYQNAVKIISNIIETNSTNTNYFGIYMYYNNLAIEVTGNQIFGSKGQYGLIMYYSNANSNNPGLISNNFIQIGGIGNAYGIYSYYSSYQNIYNNNVHITSTNSSEGYACYLYYGSDYNLKNNIFVNSGGGYTIYTTNSYNIISSDYNDFFTSGPILGYWNNNQMDLASWQSASGMDSNSFSIDPQFTSETDLHVSEISLNASGIPLAEILVDIDGELRNVSNPDIGADEFSPVLVDGGVNLIVSPNTPIIAGINNIVVSLRNFGLNDITSATIEWKLNGISQTPYSFSGNLISGDTAHLTVGSHNFINGLDYDFKAWAVVSGDQAHNNDTTELLDQRIGLSGIYTIGGSSPDFVSFGAAIVAINSRGVIDSVIFNVRNGTYTEQLNLIPFLGPNVANTITFQSESGNSNLVILTFAANSSNNFTVNLNGIDGVNFKKMTIRSTQSTYGRVFNIQNGANDILIDSCFLQGVATTSTSDLRAVIYSVTSKDDNNFFTNNQFLNGSYGLYLSSANSNDLEVGTMVEHNHFLNQYYMGIRSEYQNAVKIRTNVIETNSAYTNNYGIYMYVNELAHEVTGNKIFGSKGQYGINLSYCNANSGNNGLVANNFIQVGGVGESYGIFMYNSSYQNLYYNSVNITSTYLSGGYACYLYAGSNLNLQNNIFANTGGGFVIYTDGGYNISYSDYNNLFTTGASLGYWNTNVNNLSDWQNASGRDSNSISIDPQFLSVTDLHVSNVLMNNEGSSIPNINVDIDGEVRDSVHPDIGADEFFLTNNDAGITNILSPAEPFTIGQQEASVVLKNFGAIPLSNVTINWEFNNSLQTPFNWSGMLIGEQSTEVVIGNVAIDTGIAYNMSAWTSLPNGVEDEDKSNDTASVVDQYATLFGVINVVPDTFDISISSCNDSITVPLTIYNTGSDILHWNIDGSASNSGFSVAIIAAENSTAQRNDVQNMLINTGKFSSVANINAASITPTLLELQQYDAVLVWSNNGFANSTTLGNNLADYIDEGGGVVCAMFTLGTVPLGGRFNSDNYWAIAPSSQVSGSSTFMGSIYDPNHPVLRNVVSFNGGTSSFRPSSFGIAVGATRIVDWSDGRPLVAVKEQFDYKRIDLGFYPPSSNVVSGYWDASSDGDLLMANALQFVAGGFPEWFTLSSDSGSIAIGDSFVIDAEFNALGLIEDQYETEIVINSSDASNPQLVIPVLFSVTGNPNIALSGTGLDFQAVPIGLEVHDTLMIYNIGCDTLVISDITTSSSAFYVDTSQLIILPYDSFALIVNFLPDSAVNYSESLTIYNNDTDTTIGLFGTGLPSPEISLIPNSLDVTINGCQDTLCTNFYIYNTGTDILNWDVLANSDLNDDFDPNIDLNIWSSVTGATASANCGSVLGNALYFNGNGTREVVTKELSVIQGNMISFYLKIGVGSFPCENADGGEDVWLQYSVNGGGTWIIMKIYNVNDYPAFTLIQEAVPIGAQGFSTKFRWVQPSHSGTSYDNWSIDNVTINSTSGNVDLSSVSGTTNPGDSSLVEVCFNSNNLIRGLYQSGIIIISNDPVTPQIVLPYELNIDGDPLIVLSNSSVDFGNIPVNTNQKDTILINNNGCDDLVISNISINNVAFSVGLSSFVVAPYDTGLLVITFSPTLLGIHNATMTIFNNDQNIDVTLTGYGCTGIPTITAGGSTTICIGDSVQLTSSVVSNIVWSTGETSASIYAKEEGYYTVAYSDTLGCEAISTPIRVNVMQGVGITTSGSTTLCFGDSVTLTANVAITSLNTLSAGLSGSNLYNGNMFDIKALNTILITDFEGHIENNSDYSIYYKVGSYVGFESDFTAWTLLGTAENVVANPFGSSTIIPIFTNITIPASETYGFYITSSSGAKQYSTNGSYVGNIYASDANMQIKEGTGNVFPFGTATAYKRWNGKVNYRTMDAGLGQYLWNTGSVTRSIKVAPTDTTLYTVTAINHIGCNFQASKVVNVIPYTPPGMVSNMLPGNGLTNLTLPVTFSWLPATNATLYDFYLWLSTDAPPATPTVANLTQISYLYSGTLVYGATYNWRVKSKNNCFETNGPIQSFTVINLPDIIVNSVQTPTAAFSGQSINVDWEIKNLGPGSTGSQQWLDVAYLSSDPLLDVALDVYLGGVGNLSSLNSGQSYLKTSTFTLPQGIAGNYYIIIYTDRYNALLESNDNNNQGVNTIAMLVNLTPPPDLKVTSIITPNTVFSSQTINVTWTVKNDGTGSTVNSIWSDRVYLSTEEVFTGNGTILGTFSHNGELDADNIYSNTVSVNIPNNIFGRYFIYVKTDIYNQIYEHASENNNDSRSDSINIILTPPPDLVVTSVTVPASGSNLGSILVQWSVQNLGGTAPIITSWQDRIYLTTAADYNLSGAVVLGNLTHNGSINPGDSYNAQASVTIPTNINGPYYVYVQTDINNAVFEFNNENNNTLRSSSVTVNSPDLIVSSIVAPTSDTSGQTILVQWEVENDGNGTVYSNNWTDRIMLSSSATYNPTNVIELGTLTYSSTILPGNHVSKQKSVTLPNGISGNYYLYIQTDFNNTVYEFTLEGNNINTIGYLLNIALAPWPDLQVPTVQVQDTATAGDLIPVNYSVINHGTASATTNSWKDKIYISNSLVWNLSTAILLKQIIVSQSLLIDSSYSINTTVSLPVNLGPGNYYIHVFTDADNEVFEHTDENNNVKASAVLYVNPYPPVDIAVVTAIGPDSVETGELVNLQWTVQNVGGANTSINSWYDAIYLSLDTIWNISSDIYVNKWSNVSTLAPGASYIQNKTFNMPNSITGNYYIIVATDYTNLNQDIETSNNYKVITDGNGTPISTNIVLSQPRDLVVNSLAAPTQGISGQPIEVNWTVTNQGVGSTTSGSWTDRIYLSTDFNVSNTDIILGSYIRSSNLNSNSSYSDSLQVFLPISAYGNYVLIIKTDYSNNEYEHLAEDNNTAFSLITIVLPPPSDLVVSSISHPNSAFAGSTINVEWKVKNRGLNPTTGYMKDIIYMSIDTIWNIDDIYFGEFSGSINLAPQGEMSRNLSAELNGVSLGQYHVIVRTDILNNIFESNDTNNTTASVNKVNIDVRELPLNQWVDDTLVDLQELYYRIEIPDSLIGESLLVLLKGDSLNGNNEFYIRYNNVPTRVIYDYAHYNPYQGNQELIVPSLQQGTYYLLTYGSTSIGNQQDISLYARILDFEIRSVVANSGGNTGLVSVKINGSKFDNSLSICLARNGDTICANSVLYIDPITAFATFDLNGAELGVYDVIGEKLNGEIAVLTGGFNVVSGLPPDLQVNVLYPSNSRPSRIISMTVEFSNAGNTDLINPILVMNSNGGAPISFTIEGLDDQDLTLELPLEEVNGIPGILRPGVSGSIIVYSRALTGLAFNILIPNFD